MLLASMFRSEEMLIKALAAVFGDCLDWSDTREMRDAVA